MIRKYASILIAAFLGVVAFSNGSMAAQVTKLNNIRLMLLK